MIELFLSWTGLFALLAVFVAGVVQGSTGFGFNMLAAPLLAIVDQAFVPGAMLFLASVVCVGAALREWRAVHLGDLGWALTGRAISAVAAAFVIGMLSPEGFAGVFGAAILLAVVLSLWGLRIQTTPKVLLGAGLVSGFMGTLTSIGSPPMAIAYQNAEPARMRATLSVYFLVGGLISMLALATAGRFGLTDLLLGLMLMPVAMLGYLVSGPARHFVTKERVRPLVIAVSLGSALVLLARAFS